MRVFIARSDPALHYGLLSAVLMSKIALYKLKSLEVKTQTPIYPIIGVGSMPFRGHLSPANIQGFLNEYKGVYTVTIQSALRYDYQPEETKVLIRVLNEKLPNGEIPSVTEDEKISLNLISKTTSYYQDVIEPLAPLINSVASLVPPRRARKIHVGLFGYSRMIRTAQLPRAIPFACALYSLGVPPEFVGLRILNELTEKEWQVLQEYYLNMETDLKNVAGITSHQCLDLLKQEADKVAVRANVSKERLLESINYLQKDLDAAESNLGIKIGPTNLKQRKYENHICNFIISFIMNEEDARKNMVEAALLRKCLG